MTWVHQHKLTKASEEDGQVKKIFFRKHSVIPDTIGGLWEFIQVYWRISSWFSYYKKIAIHFIHLWINESADIRSHYMTKLYSRHSPLIRRKGKPNKTPPSMHTVSVFTDAKNLYNQLWRLLLWYSSAIATSSLSHMYRISRLHNKNRRWWVGLVCNPSNSLRRSQWHLNFLQLLIIDRQWNGLPNISAEHYWGILVDNQFLLPWITPEFCLLLFFDAGILHNEKNYSNQVELANELQ